MKSSCVRLPWASGKGGSGWSRSRRCPSTSCRRRSPAPSRSPRSSGRRRRAGRRPVGFAGRSRMPCRGRRPRRGRGGRRTPACSWSGRPARRASAAPPCPGARPAGSCGRGFPRRRRRGCRHRRRGRGSASSAEAGRRCRRRSCRRTWSPERACSGRSPPRPWAAGWARPRREVLLAVVDHQRALAGGGRPRPARGVRPRRGGGGREGQQGNQEEATSHRRASVTYLRPTRKRQR